jgi:hypothetical protein
MMATHEQDYHHNCCNCPSHIRYGPPPLDEKEMRRNVESIVNRLLGRQKMETAMNGALLRLKMSVESVKKVCNGDGEVTSEEIGLRAVYGPEGSPNNQWSKWTPNANLTMTVSNQEAFDKVKPGQFMFVDLIPTDKESI